MKKKRVYLRVERKISPCGFQPTKAYCEVVGALKVAYHRPLNPAFRKMWVASDPDSGVALFSIPHATRESCRAFIIANYELYAQLYQSTAIKKAREEMEAYLSG